MSVGPKVKIVYHLPGIARRRTVAIASDGSAAGGNDARELGVVVRGNEEVRRVSVRPSVPVVIDEITMRMDVCIGDADAIYLNGYNSWTDSVERPVNDRMWGLSRVMRQVVDAYVLDGSGDYRFVSEDARRGHMHGFGYGYLRQGDEVLLFGSLNEDNGFTLIREDLEEGCIRFEKEPPAYVMAAEEERELISVALIGGELRDCVRRWLSLAGVRPRSARPLIGYTSWYRHYGKISEDALRHDLESTSAILGGLDLGEASGVFQIDDGYAKVGDWLEYDRSRFPEGLQVLAREAEENNLLPGLWLAPFLCEVDSRLYAEHPGWILRDDRGDPVTTGSHWSGAVALNTRNAEVRSYVRDVMRTVTQEWGFRLLKLDFLYAACMEPHDGLNRGELIADALDLLRESVGDDVSLLFCGVPFVSSFGRCEYCRVGPDVGLDWDDLPHARLLHRERVSTKWSLANARGRAHLDGLAFRCDPDVFFLRDEGVKFTEEQRKEMRTTDASCGGVMFTSDDMSAWNVHQLDEFHEMLEAFLRYNDALDS